MALPDQVRLRAERANQLIAEINGEQAANAPAPSDPPADPPQPTDPQEPAPTAAPVEPPAPSPAPEPSDDWRQKYLTLQGVFNAESRRWQGEKQNLESRLASLEAAAKAPAPAAPAPAPSTFSAEELDRFGPDLLNLITAKAGAMAEQIVTAKMAELTPTLQKTAQQVAQIGQSVYDTKEQEFWGELATAVPDHQQVNGDPRWLEWLGGEDELSGVPRQTLLDNAAGKLDHKRVAKLFEAFKKATGQASPPAPSPAPGPAMPPVSPSPRSVGNASAPTPREPQAALVKRSEIRAHYRRSSSDPTYKASPEYSQMEQRITQATIANRIVEG